MTEFNWDLAPEGADSLKQSVNEDDNLQWFRGQELYLGGGDYAHTLSPSDWQTIATRPAPSEPHKTVEAYVKEQESEGWTHTDSCGRKCKILVDDPDSDGYIVLVDEGGEYGLAKYDDLEPIEKSKSIISD